MNKKLNCRRQSCLIATALISYLFIESCYSLPKPPVLSKNTENVKIIEFNPSLDVNRFEEIGQSACNLRDIAAPLRDAQELCFALFKNEAAEKGANFVMVNTTESTAIYSNVTVNGERYINKIDMTGYFIKVKQK